MGNRAAFLCSSVAVAAAAGVPRGVAAQATMPLNGAITSIYFDAVPILHAQKAGLFARAGIDLTLGRVGSGAAITAAVAGGSLDFGKSSFSSIVAAFGRGIPLTLIAPAAIYDVKQANEGLVVLKDSPIHGVTDLPGKTIAVNSLSADTRLAFAQWLSRSGLSYDSVRFVEIGMSAMAPALDARRVDGIQLTSPIMDEVLALGKYRFVSPVLGYIAPRWLFSAFFTRPDWAAAHKDVVKRFADVITASAAYYNAHHAEMLPEIADLTDATLAAVTQTNWPVAGTALVPAELQPVIDVAAKYGAIPKRFDARDMIFDSTRA